MNVSQSNLHECIRLYLNDLSDYGTEDQNYVLTESTLNSLKQTIVESKQDISVLLEEILNKSTPEKQEILEDFMLYIKEI